MATDPETAEAWDRGWPKFWWRVAMIMGLLSRAGWGRPYLWAHQKWLDAHCAAVSREMS